MRQAFILTIFLSIAAAIWLYPTTEEVELTHQGAIEINHFTVHLEGEVNFPGEYEFYESITLERTIQFAGGLKQHADVSGLNLSLTLTKDRQIIIPKLGDVFTPEAEKVNINTASFSELIKVPYMTESRAAQLIIYREQVGYFNDLEDLIFVKYIGVATLEKIKPYLTL
jgi:competence protein ComEA